MANRVSVALALVLLTACTTLPGYQGGPMPRSTQYTYPGRAWNPDSGMAHSPIAEVAAPTDGGTFVYGLVFGDGSTAMSVGTWDAFAACERARADYAPVIAQRVKEGGASVMTIKCHRAHETGGMQTR